MRLVEFLDPKKPTNIKTKRQKKLGVQGSHSLVIIKEFNTSHGNNVKVCFQKIEDPFEDEDFQYTVYFYVNDTMHDRDDRDPQIFPMVLYVIKSFIERNKVTGFKFIAISSTNDEKTVRGMDEEKFKREYFKKLQVLVDYMKANPKKEIEPSQKQIDLYKKVNRPLPKFYNIQNYDKIVDALKNLLANKDNNQYIYSNGYSIVGYFNPTIENSKMLNDISDAHSNFVNSMKSNTEDGVQIKKNRRAVVYKKLIDKFLSDWDVNIDGDHFQLLKKN
jgi:hypothetical protein